MVRATSSNRVDQSAATITRSSAGCSFLSLSKQRVRSSVYTVLNDRAQLEGEDLEANWNTYKIVNGVDH